MVVVVVVVVERFVISWRSAGREKERQQVGSRNANVPVRKVCACFIVDGCWIISVGGGVGFVFVFVFG